MKNNFTFGSDEPKPVDPRKLAETELIARTVFGEARGETLMGKVAVAWVIKNRADNPRWWGTDLFEVCLNPWQFTTWWKKDANNRTTRSTPMSDPRLSEAFGLTVKVFSGQIKDPTGGADHFHVVGRKPKWAQGKRPTRIIGRHAFYRLEI